MPTFDIYKDILEKLTVSISEDPRFRGITVFYDEDLEENNTIIQDTLPLINVFLDTDGESNSIGTQVHSTSHRDMTIRVGIFFMDYDDKRNELDARLSIILGDLLDFLFERRAWDIFYVLTGKSIAMEELIDINFGAFRDENSYMGGYKLITSFILRSAC